jgi:hypothetical protein
MNIDEEQGNLSIARIRILNTIMIAICQISVLYSFIETHEVNKNDSFFDMLGNIVNSV